MSYSWARPGVKVARVAKIVEIRDGSPSGISKSAALTIAEVRDDLAQMPGLFLRFCELSTWHWYAAEAFRPLVSTDAHREADIKLFRDLLNTAPDELHEEHLTELEDELNRAAREAVFGNPI